jgi:hypothetical protein
LIIDVYPAGYFMTAVKGNPLNGLSHFAVTYKEYSHA